ncbi:MAG: hypothetical protein E6H84_13995 [Chloroflexi bacterium]|nr:MAG: hypothetical protein E6H84_13995 [Chloroflexota bacterium]TMG65741.1 MAG: hypothetical protein E6H81_14860 [Chloroflexota bacterium]
MCLLPSSRSRCSRLRRASRKKRQRSSS